MFRDRLKALRAEHGLTQEALAELVGVERSSIGKYESIRSAVIPSTEVLERMASLFHVSVDFLLDRTDEQNESISIHDNMVMLCYDGRRIIRRVPPEKLAFLVEIIDHLAEK